MDPKGDQESRFVTSFFMCGGILNGRLVRLILPVAMANRVKPEAGCGGEQAETGRACLICGYDLSGQTVDRCPECGLKLALSYRDPAAWGAVSAGYCWLAGDGHRYVEVGTGGMRNRSAMVAGYRGRRSDSPGGLRLRRQYRLAWRWDLPIPRRHLIRLWFFCFSF